MRACVAQLETAGALPAAAGAAPRVRLGSGLRLDLSLGGGLARPALHEIVAGAAADTGAASGFALALAARFAAEARGAVLWVGEAQACREAGLPYAPGLRLLGLDPARLVFVRARTAQDALWAVEEALKSRACAAVLGELWTLKDYDLTASRRLVLAAQAGATPALLLATGLAGGAARLSTGAATRFEVRASPSAWLAPAGGCLSLPLPLPGLAAWGVRLAKARAGPGAVGLDHDRFTPIVWDHEEGLFRDTLSRPVAADARDRPRQAPAPSSAIVRAFTGGGPSAPKVRRA